MISKVTFTPAMASASAVTLHDPATSTTRFLRKVDGLVGPPAPRDVTRVRPGVDGIVDQTAYLGERSITLEGELWGATAGASLNDLSTISESLYSSLLSPGRLEWTLENGDVRWCNCKLAGGIETSVEGASRLVQYQLQLRASDPRVYKGPYATAGKSVTLTAPGSGLTWTATSATATNSGTAAAPVTVTITKTGASTLTVQEVAVAIPSAYGSIVPQTYSGLISNPSFSIVGAGTGFTVAGSGGTRSFYSATRTATSLVGVDSETEFPFLYPGTNTTVGVAASSTNVSGGEVVFSWFDAYW